MVIQCRIAIDGAETLDEAMDQLQIMLDDYADNNGDYDGYAEISVSDIKVVSE